MTTRFEWERREGDWILTPCRDDGQKWRISVRRQDWFWLVCVGDRPMKERYTSEQGAKLDAWQFAQSKCRALFGAYKIELSA
jgi:hypothetical protein